MWSLFLVIEWTIVAVFASAQSYDSKMSLFHPSGTILQLEYAKKAANSKNMLVGIACNDGVLCISPRRHSPSSSLLLPSSVPDNFCLVDSHVLLAASGFTADIAAVNELAKRICFNHRAVFSSAIPLVKLCDHLADSLHEVTVTGTRPVGANFMLCGHDDNLGYQLFTVNCDGTFHGWKAAAIGRQSDVVYDRLESMYDQQLLKKKGEELGLGLFRMAHAEEAVIGILRDSLRTGPLTATEDNEGSETLDLQVEKSKI